MQPREFDGSCRRRRAENGRTNCVRLVDSLWSTQPGILHRPCHSERSEESASPVGIRILRTMPGIRMTETPLPAPGERNGRKLRLHQRLPCVKGGFWSCRPFGSAVYRGAWQKRSAGHASAGSRQAAPPPVSAAGPGCNGRRRVVQFLQLCREEVRPCESGSGAGGRRCWPRRC